MVVEQCIVHILFLKHSCLAGFRRLKNYQYDDQSSSRSHIYHNDYTGHANPDYRSPSMEPSKAHGNSKQNFPATTPGYRASYSDDDGDSYRSTYGSTGELLHTQSSRDVGGSMLSRMMRSSRVGPLHPEEHEMNIKSDNTKREGDDQEKGLPRLAWEENCGRHRSCAYQ